MFKIIKKEKTNKYKIQFLKTGYITLAYKQSIEKGLVKDKFIYKLFIGKIYKNISNKEFIIIKYTGLNKNNIFTFDVKFIKSGEIVNTDIYRIIIGKVKDPAIIINNIIFSHGDNEYRKEFRKNDNKLYHTLQHRWCSMIDRCYNENNNSYINYGKKGITVSKSWHTFSNYLKDVIYIDGFNRDLIVSGKLELDKDYLQNNSVNKIYSKNTCLWISIKNNNYMNMNKLVKRSTTIPRERT